MKVLFVMRHSGYLRNFESTLRLLAQRGHRVHVAFELEERAVLRGASQMERLSAEQLNIGHGPAPRREQETWFEFIAPVRRAIDYLRFLSPDYDDAPKLRARAARGVPAAMRRIAASPSRRPRLGRVLRALDQAVPPSRSVERLIRDHDPDLMLVTPLVGLGSPQGDYVRAAKALGVRTGLCVASWDNLTNKGLIRDVPDVVTVWNDAQRREAVEMHGVPEAAVVATGAQAYDHWFEWRADRTRERFAAETGLPADRPFLLYLCSSPFIAPNEVGFVRDWLRRLRADAVLGRFGVLVRPHPQNAAQWRSVDLSDLGDAVVWPRLGANPVDDRSKADFFNSIHHCEAVVGVNTSALIESAVVGRPVFTVLAEQFADTQEGTLHFRHLVETGGGFLSKADTFEEHFAQLAAAVGPEGSRDEALARARRFLETFVRPAGLDQAATPRLADAIERAASARRPAPRVRPGWAVALGVVLTPVAHVVTRWARAQQLLKRTVLRVAGRHLPERVKEPLRGWLSIPEAPAPASGDGRPDAASSSNGAAPPDPEGRPPRGRDRRRPTPTALSAPSPAAPRALRIAHLTATFPPYTGGAGTTAFHLSRGLAERGHHVEVFTARAEGDAPDSGGVVVHRLEPLAAIGNAPLIPRIATVRDFDVLHLHHPFIFGTELVLAGRLRSRSAAVVVSYHNRLIGEGARRAMFFAYEETVGRALMRAADRVAVVSRAHARTVSYLRALERRRPEALAVLPNGVDVTAFCPGPDAAGVRAAHGIPPDVVVGAFVAALDRAHFFKRLDLALDALGSPGSAGAHLVVVGGGELLEPHRAEVRVRGLEGRVHFLGALDHERLPAVLRACDFLLLTSDLESFGIVLIEAMACGLPTVATDLPGVMEVVNDGETGLIARRGDAADIARAVAAMVALGPAERAEMGRRGRAECERRYAWPRLVSRLEEVYAEALRARRPAASPSAR